MSPLIEMFYDKRTCALTYVIADEAGGRAAIVDPVLDYEPTSGRTSTEHADEVLAYVRGKGLTVDWLLETHAHADHLSAAGYLKAELGAQTGIGSQIGAVQAIWKDVFGLEPEFPTDGSQFDHLFADGETFRIGDLEGRVLHTPGHTPACVTYVVGDAACVGDTVFMPDFGSARTDFPGGDPATLYRSIRRILALPGDTSLLACHDYLPGGRALEWESTVAEQRAGNPHVRDGIDEAAFIALRQERDSQLAVPSLLLPSVQVNIRAGELPPPAANGTSYLKIPLNAI